MYINTPTTRESEMALFLYAFRGVYKEGRCIQVQDITREPIDIIIKASESAVSQAVDFAIKTDEINKRLIKSKFKEHVVTCVTFALILIFLFWLLFCRLQRLPRGGQKRCGRKSRKFSREYFTNPQNREEC